MFSLNNVSNPLPSFTNPLPSFTNPLPSFTNPLSPARLQQYVPLSPFCRCCNNMNPNPLPTLFHHIPIAPTGGTVSALLSDEDAADDGRLGGRTFVGGRTLMRTAASMTFADKTGPGPGPRAKTTVDAAVLGGDRWIPPSSFFFIYITLFITRYIYHPFHCPLYHPL